jgi:hypothetical protein
MTLFTLRSIQSGSISVRIRGAFTLGPKTRLPPILKLWENLNCRLCMVLSKLFRQDVERFVESSYFLYWSFKCLHFCIASSCCRHKPHASLIVLLCIGIHLSFYGILVVLVVSFGFPMYLLAQLFPLPSKYLRGWQTLCIKMWQIWTRKTIGIGNQCFNSLWVRLSVHIARGLRWIDLRPPTDVDSFRSMSVRFLAFTLRSLCHGSVWDRSISLVWTRLYTIVKL